MARLLVLGGSGMLGSMIVDWLARDPSLKVGATVRADGYLPALRALIPKVGWHLLDVHANAASDTLSILEGYDWIINAIGVVKPFIDDNDSIAVERAIHVNALFPHRLARKAEACGCRVIQIATDCVYSGRDGCYTEEAPHDPVDVYGKTKSLGEVFSANVFHLRCSIIGPEFKNYVSLLSWFLRQRSGAKLTGFINHRWNGVTTLHFAKICQGIIKHGLELSYVHHVVPTGMMTKAEMLEKFAELFARKEIEILHGEARTAVDRTLDTKNGVLNNALWQAAGYPRAPTITRMIEELRAFNYRFTSIQTR